MSILITGGNGYIAKSISNSLTDKNTIFSPNRQELNILNYNLVNNYIKNNNIKIIIHTAITGGSRLRVDTSDDLYMNLLMFENITKAAENNNVNLLINISSGAAFSRDYNIENAEEVSICKNIPSDYYGLSKYFIDKQIKNYNHTQLKIINLRVFGLFSFEESNSRFIKSCINNFNNNQNVEIFKDIYFDFFYVDDFINVINYVIENYNNLLFNDINTVYNTKYKLSEIAYLVKKYYNTSSKIIINEIGQKHYSGSSKRLELLNLNLLGFEKSLEMYIQNISKSK
jgi:nucleoside-diphosphate-sugar epimerase